MNENCIYVKYDKTKLIVNKLILLYTYIDYVFINIFILKMSSQPLISAVSHGKMDDFIYSNLL